MESRETKLDLMDLTVIIDTGTSFPNDDGEKKRLMDLLLVFRERGVFQVVTHRNTEVPITAKNSGMTRMLNLSSGIGRADALNIALSGIKSQFVMVIDLKADDVSLQAVNEAVRLLRRDHGTHYVFGAHDSTALPGGAMPVGSIISGWGSPHMTFPVAPNSVVIRRSSLLSVGGFAAIPECEGLMTALRLSNAYRGFQSAYSIAKGEVGLSLTSLARENDGHQAMSLLEMCFEMSYVELKNGRFGSTCDRDTTLVNSDDIVLVTDEEDSRHPVEATNVSSFA